MSTSSTTDSRREDKARFAVARDASGSAFAIGRAAAWSPTACQALRGSRPGLYHFVRPDRCTCEDSRRLACGT